MKLPKNRKYDTIAVYVLLVIAFTLVFASIFVYLDNLTAGIRTLLGVLKPVFYGLFMAMLFNPLYTLFYSRTFAFVERKKPHATLRRTLSILLTYLLILAVLSAIVMIVIPQVIASYTELSGSFRFYLSSAKSWIDSAFGRLPELRLSFPDTSASRHTAHAYINAEGRPISTLGMNLQQLEANPLLRELRALRAHDASFSLSETINRMLDSWYKMLTNLMPTVLSSAMKIVTETKNLVMGLIVSIYVLLDQRRIRAGFAMVCEALLPRKLCQGLPALGNLLYASFVRFFSGKIADGAVMGLLCFCMMELFRFPFAPVVSVVIGIMNIIPYLGPILGVLVTTFIVFIFKPGAGLWYLIAITLLHQVDIHFVEPYVVRSHLRMPSVWILIAVILMGDIFGVLGMFISVPVFSVLQVVVGQWLNERIARKERRQTASAEKDA